MNNRTVVIFVMRLVKRPAHKEGMVIIEFHLDPEMNCVIGTVFFHTYFMIHIGTTLQL
jgi:hypothetical protein